MDGMDKPMGSPAVRGLAGRPLVSAGSLDEELLGLERSLPGAGLMRPSVGQGIASAGSLDDELMRLVGGSSPVLPAAEERFVTALFTLAGPIDPQSAIVETAAVITTADAVPDPQFGVDFWEAAQQRKAAIIARRKSGQREETSDDESQEVQGARIVSAGLSAGIRDGFGMEVERDAEDSPEGQIVSLSNRIGRQVLTSFAVPIALVSERPSHVDTQTSRSGLDCGRRRNDHHAFLTWPTCLGRRANDDGRIFPPSTRLGDGELSN